MARPVRLRMPEHINPAIKQPRYVGRVKGSTSGDWKTDATTKRRPRRTDKTHGMNDEFFEKFVDAGVELQVAGVCNDDTLAMLAMLKTVDRETLKSVELAIARVGKKSVQLAVRGL